MANIPLQKTIKGIASMTRRSILALLSLPCFGLAMAVGDGDLWVGMAAIICLEQDASYRDTPIGDVLFKDPGYQQWRVTQT